MVNVSIYTSTMDPMGNFLAQHLGISFGESELSSGNGSTGQRHLEGPGDLHMARCGGQAAYLDMAMDQYLLIPFFVGWTSINPSYFDVHQGYKVLTHCHILMGKVMGNSPVIKHCNWTFPLNGGVIGKIIEQGIPNCHVWLPEGISMNIYIIYIYVYIYIIYSYIYIYYVYIYIYPTNIRLIQ